MAEKQDILKAKTVVINLGIKEFAENLVRQDVKTVFVNWKPPLQDEEMAELLDNLL